MTRRGADRSRHEAGKGPGEWLVVAFVVLAVVLGGASAPDSTYGFALQLVSAAFLTAGLWWARRDALPLPPEIVCIGLGFLALVVVQMVPLPPQLWQALPGRTVLAESLALAGVDGTWLPYSLDSGSTIAAALAAVPPVALLALLSGCAKLPVKKVSLAVLALAFASALLGVAQFMAGRESLLYIHSFTNWGLAVGFFANANHLTTLLLIGAPLLAALAAVGAASGKIAANAAVALLVAYVGFAAMGITLAASVAGMLLLPVAAGASLLLIPAKRAAKLWAVAASALGAGAAVALSVGVLGTGFSGGEGSRQAMWAATWAGIRHFWPLGSGLGTFPAAYRLFENPAEVTSTYVNHAHNDYLEVLLENGLIGGLLMAAVLAWYAIRSRQAWTGSRGTDALWPRAASIVLGLILLHSAGDYPLRTPAMLVIFAFFAVVLATRPDRLARPARSEGGRARPEQHGSHRPGE